MDMKEDNKAIKQVFIGADKVCDRRKLDAQRIATYFTKNGYEIVTNPKKAEIIIIFSCSVTNAIADISLNYVKKFMEYDGELIVAGCLPETDKKVMDKIFTGKKLSAKEMEKIDIFFPKHVIKFNQINDTNIPWINIDETRLSDVFKKIIIRTKIGRKMYVYFIDYILKRILGKNYLILSQFMSILYNDYCVIRVSQGCLNNCAYCATKRAIGNYKSKPLDECVKEFKIGLEKGFTNFVLTGDDTGAYGVDIDSSFPELLDTLTKIDGCYNFTIHALNPNWVVKYIAEIEPILRRGKIKIISIPVQSGSDRILKMMHRFSRSEKMKEVLVKVKKASPGLVLDTHVIVGFPSETADEFKESLELIKEVGFDSGSIIPVSIRPDTEIEKIKTKVPDPEIKRRLKIGRNYLRNIGYATNKSLMGGIIFSKKN
jgi:tRNA A37 methylthiotransferase MiaB